MAYEAVVISVSAGGVSALKELIPALPAAFPLAIAIVQHRDPRSDEFLSEYLSSLSRLKVKEAEDKEPIMPGYVYLAPAGYHLLVEADKSFSLSVDPRVNYSCPSSDVLFESAAEAYGPSLIGIVLTGGNADGALGLKRIKEYGGLTVVQHPDTAEASAMPKAALAVMQPDYVVALEDIAPLLTHLLIQEHMHVADG